MLPSWIKVPIRSIASRRQKLRPFSHFTVADLFYARADLERAIDLLAVCRLEPSKPDG
jgi:hypothetical protein